MLPINVQQAINEQVNNEFNASYSYLAMSIFCQRKNFVGWRIGCESSPRKKPAMECDCSIFFCARRRCLAENGAAAVRGFRLNRIGF